MFTDAQELRKCQDLNLKQLCEGSENCRRVCLLRGLGSDEDVAQTTTQICCDACSSHCVVPELNCIEATKQKRCQLRHAIRSISRPLQDELKKRLLQERDSIVDSDISYKILGKDLVIPKKCIEVLCMQAHFISSINDISVPGLRVEFVPRFFTVIMEVLNCH